MLMLEGSMCYEYVITHKPRRMLKELFSLWREEAPERKDVQEIKLRVLLDWAIKKSLITAEERKFLEDFK